MNKFYCPYKYDPEKQQDYVSAIIKFLQKDCEEELVKIMLHSDESIHYGLKVRMIRLLEHNLPLGTLTLAYTEAFIVHFKTAIRLFQRDILSQHTEKERMSFKPLVNPRFCNLPSASTEICRTNLPRSVDVGRFISISGTVTSTGPIKMLQYEKDFVCAKCNFQFVHRGDITIGYEFPEITKCPSEGGTCKGAKFVEKPETGVCRDYQEIKLQEQISNLTFGSIPRSIYVVLEDDIVDSCKAGDDVVICGLVMTKWKPLIPGERCDIEIFIRANSVHVKQEKNVNNNLTEELRGEFEKFWKAHINDPMLGRAKIIRSVCPDMYGMFTVKLGLLLTIIGGVQKKTDSIKIRGISHLLLVGGFGPFIPLSFTFLPSPFNVSKKILEQESLSS